MNTTARKVFWALLIWTGAFLGSALATPDAGVAKAVAKMEDAQREYIRSVASVSAVDELERLAALKEKGVISEEEFAAQKAKVLAG